MKAQLYRLRTKFSVFTNKVSHIGKKYYPGTLVRWLIGDKRGNSVYCDKCRNIANGVIQGKVMRRFPYTVPLCKSHLDKHYRKQDEELQGISVKDLEKMRKKV